MDCESQAGMLYGDADERKGYYFIDDTYNATVPCNYNVGSVNQFSGVVEYTDYGYLVNGPSTYVCVTQ